jgi:hypothetical protein
MPQDSFPVQNYNTADGKPVVDGYLLIHIDYDALSPMGQIGARIKVEVALGSIGQILNDPQFWENMSLIPSDTVYILEAFNADGLRILGPLPVTIGPTVSGLGFGQAFGSSFGS